jgi:hypothetical protein
MTQDTRLRLMASAFVNYPSIVEATKAPQQLRRDKTARQAEDGGPFDASTLLSIDPERRRRVDGLRVK